MTGSTPAIVAAAAAIFIWIITRVYEIWTERAKNDQEAQANIRALHAEIDFNTRDMELFLSGPSSMNAIIRRVTEDRAFIPHVTDAQHTEIYRTRIPSIHQMGDGVIGRIVYFYGLLAKIESQVNGIYLPSYPTISPTGRANVIRRLFSTCDECRLVGLDVLRRLQEAHPHLHLSRELRLEVPPLATDEELATRLRLLSSDLDRIRSRHHDRLS